MECRVEIENRNQLETARRKARDEAERISGLFAYSGLPTAYRTRQRTIASASLPGVDAITAAVTTMKAVAEGVSRKPWVYLCGAAGSFKTTLAAGFLARDLAQGRAGKYLFYLNLLTELYAIYGGDSAGTRQEIVGRYATTPRLVIDDLGKERATEHACLALFEILDYRYQVDASARPGSRWMVITSNLSLADLGAKISAGTDDSIAEPIVRRISELAIEIPMTETVSA